MLLFAPALFRDRDAARATRPAARGDVRDSGHRRRCGAEAHVCAARLGLERPAGYAVPHRLDCLGLPALSGPRALFPARARRRRRAEDALARSSRCFALSIPVELAVAIFAVDGDPSAQQAFPYASAAFGMICVGVFRQAEGAFRGRFVRGLSFYLGRISYSVYLFHLIIVMALKPRIGGGAACPATGDLCRPDPGAVDGLLRRIRAADPGRAALLRRRAARGRRDRSSRRPARLAAFVPRFSSVALALAALAAGVLARNAFMANKPYAFYALLIATAGLALALSERARPVSTGRSPPRRGPSCCLRWRCRSPTLSTAIRLDCRSPRPSLSRPIPIARRTPIRPRSQSGGTIISTSGSGTTA